MTGNLERPSQDASENRTVESSSRQRERSITSAPRALRGLHRAEMDLLVAAQRAARQAALHAIVAALGSRHASAASAVIHRFVEQRAALAGLDANGRVAALRRLSAEEASELSRLALAHAAEKRALKRAAAQAMMPAQKEARNALRRSSRRQRIVLAVTLGPRPHVQVVMSSARARSSFKISMRQRVDPQA